MFLSFIERIFNPKSDQYALKITGSGIFLRGYCSHFPDFHRIDHLLNVPKQ